MARGWSRRGFLGTLAGSGVAAAVVKPASAEETASVVVVTSTVNGAAISLPYIEDETALTLVRERLGLTGAKEGCGHGACGACAITVDGVAVASCLLPASALDGRRVATIEGIVDHPVQRAFLAEDALQCGYCTPGFVTESVAFYERWVAERGHVAPSRDEVAAALGGHLCRCGAYEAIFRAVSGACEGKFDTSAGGLVGLGPRVDGPEKVTGKATYTVDVRLPGMLEARVLRTPHAHARIRALDVAAARSSPGVKAVIQLVPAGARVRYAGQEVVAIAAVDRAAALAAIARVGVNYDVLPAAVGLDGARKADAPIVYPDGGGGQPSASEGPYFSAPWSGNVRGPMHTDLLGKPGGAAAAVASAPVHHEGRYRTGSQSHTPLEPHAVVAHWQLGGEDGDKLTVWCSTQGVTSLAEDIADRWKLKRANVRVIASYVGGGFGSKAGVEPITRIAIDLARAAGAPVRLVHDRAEEMAVGGYRPAQEVDIHLGAHADGSLAGMTIAAKADTGLAVGNSSTFLARLIYPHASKELADFDVVSHAAPSKPMRGPGGPPIFFALESAVDEVALALAMDPIDLRRKWDPNPGRNQLYDAAAALPMWQDRGGKDTGRFRRGVGIAAASWFYFVAPTVEVRITASPDGWLAESAVQDIGNGTRTVLANLISAELGVSPTDIVVRAGDSDAPTGCLTAGSRTTGSIGPAASEAARQLATQLAKAWSRSRKVAHVVPVPGGLSADGVVVSWKDVLAALPRMQAVGRRKMDEGGWYLPLVINGTAAGKALGAAVQVSEVVVDTRLGRTALTRAWIGVACGKVVAPVLAASQLRGAVVQGIGYALHEERRLCPNVGRVLTQGLEDYRIPGMGDIPPVDVFFAPYEFEHVEGGSIGISEVATCPASPSIANAIHRATGWRPTDLPIRPERVWKGLQA